MLLPSAQGGMSHGACRDTVRTLGFASPKLYSYFSTASKKTKAL